MADEPNSNSAPPPKAQGDPLSNSASSNSSGSEEIFVSKIASEDKKARDAAIQKFARLSHLNKRATMGRHSTSMSVAQFEEAERQSLKGTTIEAPPTTTTTRLPKGMYSDSDSGFAEESSGTENENENINSYIRSSLTATTGGRKDSFFKGLDRNSGKFELTRNPTAWDTESSKERCAESTSSQNQTTTKETNIKDPIVGLEIFLPTSKSGGGQVVEKKIREGPSSPNTSEPPELLIISDSVQKPTSSESGPPLAGSASISKKNILAALQSSIKTKSSTAEVQQRDHNDIDNIQTNSPQAKGLSDSLNKININFPEFRTDQIQASKARKTSGSRSPGGSSRPFGLDFTRVAACTDAEDTEIMQIESNVQLNGAKLVIKTSEFKADLPNNNCESGESGASSGSNGPRKRNAKDGGASDMEESVNPFEFRRNKLPTSTTTTKANINGSTLDINNNSGIPGPCGRNDSAAPTLSMTLNEALGVAKTTQTQRKQNNFKPDVNDNNNINNIEESESPNTKTRRKKTQVMVPEDFEEATPSITISSKDEMVSSRLGPEISRGKSHSRRISNAGVNSSGVIVGLANLTNSTNGGGGSKTFLSVPNPFERPGEGTNSNNLSSNSQAQSSTNNKSSRGMGRFQKATAKVQRELFMMNKFKKQASMRSIRSGRGGEKNNDTTSSPAPTRSTRMNQLLGTDDMCTDEHGNVEYPNGELGQQSKIMKVIGSVTDAVETMQEQNDINWSQHFKRGSIPNPLFLYYHPTALVGEREIVPSPRRNQEMTEPADGSPITVSPSSRVAASNTNTSSRVGPGTHSIHTPVPGSKNRSVVTQGDRKFQNLGSAAAGTPAHNNKNLDGPHSKGSDKLVFSYGVGRIDTRSRSPSPKDQRERFLVNSGILIGKSVHDEIEVDQKDEEYLNMLASKGHGNVGVTRGEFIGKEGDLKKGPTGVVKAYFQRPSLETEVPPPPAYHSEEDSIIRDRDVQSMANAISSQTPFLEAKKKLTVLEGAEEKKKESVWSPAALERARTGQNKKKQKCGPPPGAALINSTPKNRDRFIEDFDMEQLAGFVPPTQFPYDDIAQRHVTNLIENSNINNIDIGNDEFQSHHQPGKKKLDRRVRRPSTTGSTKASRRSFHEIESGIKTQIRLRSPDVDPRVKKLTDLGAFGAHLAEPGARTLYQMTQTSLNNARRTHRTRPMSPTVSQWAKDRETFAKEQLQQQQDSDHHLQNSSKHVTATKSCSHDFDSPLHTKPDYYGNPRFLFAQQKTYDSAAVRRKRLREYPYRRELEYRFNLECEKHLLEPVTRTMAALGASILMDEQRAGLEEGIIFVTRTAIDIAFQLVEEDLHYCLIQEQQLREVSAHFLEAHKAYLQDVISLRNLVTKQDERVSARGLGSEDSADPANLNMEQLKEEAKRAWAKMDPNFKLNSSTIVDFSQKPIVVAKTTGVAPNGNLANVIHYGQDLKGGVGVTDNTNPADVNNTNTSDIGATYNGYEVPRNVANQVGAVAGTGVGTAAYLQSLDEVQPIEPWDVPWYFDSQGGYLGQQIQELVGIMVENRSSEIALKILRQEKGDMENIAHVPLEEYEELKKIRDELYPASLQKVETLDARVVELDKILSEMERTTVPKVEYDILVDERDALQRETEDQKEKIEDLETEHAEKVEKMEADFRTKSLEKDAQIETMTLETNFLKERVEELEALSGNAQAEIQSAMRELEQAREKLEQLQVEYAQLLEEKEEAVSMAQALQAQVDALSRELADAYEKFDAATIEREKQEAIEKALKEKEREMELAFEERMREQREKSSDLQRALDDLAALLAAKEKEIVGLRQEMLELQEKLRLLDQILKDLGHENALKNLLDDAGLGGFLDKDLGMKSVFERLYADARERRCRLLEMQKRYKDVNVEKLLLIMVQGIAEECYSEREIAKKMERGIEMEMCYKRDLDRAQRNNMNSPDPKLSENNNNITVLNQASVQINSDDGNLKTSMDVVTTVTTDEKNLLSQQKTSNVSKSNMNNLRANGASRSPDKKTIQSPAKGHVNPSSTPFIPDILNLRDYASNNVDAFHIGLSHSNSPSKQKRPHTSGGSSNINNKNSLTSLVGRNTNANMNLNQNSPRSPPRSPETTNLLTSAATNNVAPQQLVGGGFRPLIQASSIEDEGYMVKSTGKLGGTYNNQAQWKSAGMVPQCGLVVRSDHNSNKSPGATSKLTVTADQVAAGLSPESGPAVPIVPNVNNVDDSSGNPKEKTTTTQLKDANTIGLHLETQVRENPLQPAAKHCHLPSNNSSPMKNLIKNTSSSTNIALSARFVSPCKVYQTRPLPPNRTKPLSDTTSSLSLNQKQTEFEVEREKKRNAYEQKLRNNPRLNISPITFDPLQFKDDCLMDQKKNQSSRKRVPTHTFLY